MLRVPSGAIQTLMPSARRRCASRRSSMARARSERSTDMIPAALIAWEKTGIRNSSFFATMRSGPGSD